MKNLLYSLTTLLLTATIVGAQQDPTRLYSNPSVPPQEVLNRLNLKMAWRTVVPVDGRRDGLLSVYLTGSQVLVQTRSSLVVAIDAETGHVQWQAAVGQAYRPVPGLAFNSQSVFAINSTVLYALDRKTGNPQWQCELPHGAATAPVADEDQIYLSLGAGRLYVYFLPRPEKESFLKTGGKPSGPADKSASSYGGRGSVPAIGPLTSVRDASRSEATGPQPLLLWDYRNKDRLEQPPLVYGQTILMADTAGRVIGLAKEARFELSNFPTDGPVSVPLGQHTDSAYVASHDGNVYALRIETGRLLWRFTSGTGLTYKPWVTDEDVYVVPEGAGLFRLDRKTGDAVWQQKRAERFLAANPKFVYAADSSGRLLILDRARGKQLSMYDTHDFAYPISNEMTDRLFLAANNGLLVCLHDREYTKPLRSKKLDALEKTPAKPVVSAEEKAQQLKAKLAKPVAIEFDDPATTYGEALEVLGNLAQIKIAYAPEEELMKEGIEPFLKKPIKLPFKYVDTPLADVLKQLLNQVGVGYTVKPDHLFVGPVKR
jgi:outer membrane protein assembly factor BamB